LTLTEQVGPQQSRDTARACDDRRRWAKNQDENGFADVYSLAFEYRDLLTEAIVKLTRPIPVIVLLTACVMSASVASAGSGCPDDPERCVERGATVTHRTVSGTPTTVTTTTATTPGRTAPAVTTPARKAPTASAPARKTSSKPARVVSPSTPAPATPGMGMLLKLSNGSGGEVSLFPSKPNDPSGASWVL
jgi:hypothetical protein